MAGSLNELAQIGRDGTSQAARLLEALDPGYVSIDERSIEDLLSFVRQYAKELQYFDLTNQPAGDWSGFLGASDEVHTRQPARNVSSAPCALSCLSGTFSDCAVAAQHDRAPPSRFLF